MFKAQTKLSAEQADAHRKSEMSRIEGKLEHPKDTNLSIRKTGICNKLLTKDLAVFNARMQAQALKSERLELESRQVKREIQLTREDVNYQRKKLKGVLQQMHALRQETLDLKNMIKAQDERRMELFRANLSVKFVEKIGKA